MNHSFPFHCFIFFQCSIPFQRFWWLNDSMLTLATVKKTRFRFFFYIYTWVKGCELFRMNGMSLYWYLLWLDSVRLKILESQNGFRTECRMLDLKYQQSELDFCAKSLAKVIPILVCYSANCPCMGRDTYMLGTFSLIFRESIHHTVKFLQKEKKNIFKNTLQKRKKNSDHNFTCASIV